MKTTHAAVLSTLMRVQRFLDVNNPVLGTINKSAYRTVVDQAITALTTHNVNQTTTKRAQSAHTAKQRVLRNALKVNHMRPIATIAAAQLRQVPEFAALKMPLGSSSSIGLIAAAGAMKAAAINYVTTFVTAGLAPDFIAQLQSASDALDITLNSKGANLSAHSGATAGLAAEAARGRQAVKVLDTLVEPQLSGNMSLLTQWKTAKRVGGKTHAIASTSVDAAAKGTASIPGATTTPSTTPSLTPATPVPVSPALAPPTTGASTPVSSTPVASTPAASAPSASTPVASAPVASTPVTSPPTATQAPAASTSNPH